jgi:DNA-binding HxlR family transcriptional regulator
VVSRRKIVRPKFTCPISGFQKLSNGKHKLRIVWALRNGPLWFGELKRQVSAFSEFSMSPRVLTRELSFFEEYGLIKKGAATGPLGKVEYDLTDFGKKLIPLVTEICSWSKHHLDIIPPDQEAGCAN